MLSLNSATTWGKIRQVIWFGEKKRGTGGAVEKTSTVVRWNSYYRLDGDGNLVKKIECWCVDCMVGIQDV